MCLYVRAVCQSPEACSLSRICALWQALLRGGRELRGGGRLDHLQPGGDVVRRQLLSLLG